MRRDEPYGENPADAATMPIVLKIGLMRHCIPDVNRGGESVDILKPELLTWLDANSAGQWKFMYDLNGCALDYFLRFSDQNDALATKMRWF